MDRSPLLEKHRSAGVRLVPRPEAPERETPLLFGNVPGEYRAGREGCALLDTADRGRLAVRGRDATDFLHRMLANHVKALPVDGLNANLLLTAKGKVQFDFDLLRRAEGFELSTPPGRAAGLHEALERYHFAEELALEDTTSGHAPLELVGPRASEVLTMLTGTRPLGEARACVLPWREGEIVAYPAGMGWRVDAGPARISALWEALCEAGATPAGLVARDAWRVEAAFPLSGVDIDENVYPQEAGLERAFALDKGCYVGQEVVAKIDTYGGLNKRLLTLRVEHSDPIARGTRLLRTLDGERRDLGLVTSWAYSFALDAGMVLAYVKRGHQEPGTAFDLEQSGSARIVEPPCPRAGR